MLENILKNLAHKDLISLKFFINLELIKYLCGISVTSLAQNVSIILVNNIHIGNIQTV